MDDSIDRFIHEALARNISLSFANHPLGVHGFDNQINDERSREIIRSAIAFTKMRSFRHVESSRVEAIKR